ncbi:alternative ribosome rescue aminoacyl-tRNA hydrolase ArfB [Hoeflea poritis]|uniref:Alternative ribosome rescue aminoacyl-tRNA hydrolase ArfB n=1 Tax=Hoeflea poritis TaxID=2993659 RepID=A0ABT4VKY5_9HYPH|nr:alternative ribosome rescue aminoacyl-tRNA hydrolase ArfB [Hoeflea poritis]MDA4845320.1 alternative ribosome rescue aminoacyl-tRNA hydrolase ArfB [Hoeflea poritis]
MASESLYINATITVAGWELVEQFIRASGPGGQNVNKVATSVQLRFDARSSPSLPERVKHNLVSLAGRRMSKDGVIVIEADRFRTQERNRADARDRLKALIEQAAAPPPPKRKKTRPTKGAVERRLKAKAARSGIKKLRGSVERE